MTLIEFISLVVIAQLLYARVHCTGKLDIQHWLLFLLVES